MASDYIMLFTVPQLIVNAGDLIWADLRFGGDIVVRLGFGGGSMIWLREPDQNADVFRNVEIFLMDQIYNKFVMDHDRKFLPSYLRSDYDIVASI